MNLVMIVQADHQPLSRVDEYSDALTGFGSRRRLLAHLAAIIAEQAEPATLAIFDLGGFDAFIDHSGRLEAEVLLVRVAEGLAETLGETTYHYRPRYEEFAAVLTVSPFAAEPLLAAAAATLTGRFASAGLVLTYGSAMVPEEAEDPIEALSLADTRLFLRAHGRRARARRMAARSPL